MRGLMMDKPLLVSTIAEHAEKFHAEREIVSVTMDNPEHRCTIGDAVGLTSSSTGESPSPPSCCCSLISSS